MDVVLIGWMERYFCGRQSKDQPTVTGVDVRQLEDITEECPIGVSIGAKNYRMCSSDHVDSPGVVGQLIC